MNNKFPTPLSNTQWWNPGAYFLPATTLTVASLSVFISILAYIGINDELRNIFILPWYSTEFRVTASIITTILCALLVLHLKSRPSPFFTKIWVLALTVIASIVSYIEATDIVPSWWSPWWPWYTFQNTLLLATIAAFLTLSLRLLKPRIDSKLIQWITPIILLVMLPLIIGVTYLGKYAHAEMLVLEQTIEKCKEIEKEIGDYKDPMERMQKIKKHQQECEIDEKFIRLPKAILASTNLMAIESALKPENILTTSQAKGPADYYDFEDKKYKQDFREIKNNKKLLNYYTDLNTLIENARREISPKDYNEWTESNKNRLNDKLNNWSDYWITYYLPSIFPENTRDDYLDYLIRTPFLTLKNAAGQEKIVSLTDLKTIMDTSIDPDSMANLIKNTNTCFDSDSFVNKNQRYFIITCYAYNLYSESNKATVLEVRLIYTEEGTFHELALIMPQTNNPYRINANKFLSKFENTLKIKYPYIHIDYNRKVEKRYSGKSKFIYMPYNNDTVNF